MAEAMVIELQLQNYNVVMGQLNRVAAVVKSLDNPSRKAYEALQMKNQAMQFQSMVPKNLPKLPSPSISLPGIGKGGAPGLGSMLADLLPIAELAELANPIGIAIAGVTAMAAAASSAAASLTSFKESMITSGGSAAEVGRLSVYGSAAGVNNMAEIARQLADRLATNPAAAGFGASAGVHDLGGAYSPLDKAKNLQKMIDHILDPNISEQQAARFARVEQLEMFLKLRGISAETRANLDAVGRLNSLTHGTTATKQAAEFNAEIAMLETNFDTISTSLGSAMLPTMTSAVKLFNQLAPGINSTVIALEPLVKLLMMTTPFGAMAAISDLIERINKSMDNKPHTAAMDRHTAAMDAHGAALKNGTFGGGERARGALPAAWGRGNAGNWGGGGGATLLGAFNL